MSNPVNSNNLSLPYASVNNQPTPPENSTQKVEELSAKTLTGMTTRSGKQLKVTPKAIDKQKKNPLKRGHEQSTENDDFSEQPEQKKAKVDSNDEKKAPLSNAELKDKGEALRHQGKHQEALDVFTELLARDRKNAFALGARGAMLLSLDQNQNAYVDLDEAFKLQPQQGEGFIWSARARQLLQEKKEDLAFEAFFQALAIEPNVEENWKQVRSLSKSRADKGLTLVGKVLRRDLQNKHAWLYQAECLWANNQSEKAALSFEKYLAINPSDNVAANKLVHILIDRKDLPKAISYLNLIIKHEPKNVNALKQRAEIHRKLGNNNLAQQDEMEIWVLEPKKPTKKVETAFEKGIDNLNLGNFKQAQQDFDALITIDDEQIKQLLSLIKTILKADLTNELCWKIGSNILVRQRKFAEAFQFFNEFIEDNPTLAFPRLQRGLFNLRMKQFMQAEADFKHILAISGQELRARTGLALCYYEQRLYEDALREIAEMPKRHLCTMMLQYRVDYAQGKKQNVFENIDALIKQFPGVESLQELRGDLLRREKRLNEALESFNKLLQINPNQPFWLASRAAISLMLQINTEQSEQDLKTAFRLNPIPKEPFIWIARAHLNQRLNNCEAALADIKHVLEMDPSNASAWELKINILSKQHSEDELLNTLNDGLLKFPTTIPLLIKRGLIYLKKEELQQAEADFKQVLALNPGDVEAREGLVRCYYEQKNYKAALFEISQISNLSLSIKILQIRMQYMLGEKVFERIDFLIESYPEELSLLELRGDLLRRENRLVEAFTSFHQLIKKVTEINPPTACLGEKYYKALTQKYPQYPFWIGNHGALGLMLNQDLGAFGNAEEIKQQCIDNLFRAFSLNLHPKESFLWMAHAKLNEYYGDFSRTAYDLNQFIEREPDNLSAWEMKIKTLDKLGLNRKDETLKTLNEATEKFPQNVSLLVMRGNYYRKWKQNEQALNDFETAKKINPTDPQLLEALASLLIEENQLAKAFTMLTQIAGEKPPSALSLLDLMQAIQYFNQQKVEDALKYVDRALKFNPDHLEAKILRIKILLARGKTQEAENATSFLLEFNPHLSAVRLPYMQWLRQKGEIQQALTQTHLFLKHEPQHAGVLAMRGALFLQMDNLRQSKEMIEKALKINPDEPEALEIQREILWSEGKENEVLKEFTDIIEKNPQDSYGYFKRGLFFLKKQKNTEALADLSEAHKKNPTDTKILAALGEVQVRMQMYDEASKNLKKALKHDLNDYSVLTSIAKRHQLKNKNKLAWRCIADALKHNPYYCPALVVRGDLLLAENKRDEARADFALALQMNPADVSILKRVALCDYHKGMLFEPLTTFEKILEKTPNDLFVRARYGDILRRQGKNEQALKYLDNPNDPFALACYGDLIKNSNRQKAFECFTSAIKLNPLEPLAVMNCGVILMNAGQLDDALEQFASLTRSGHHPSAWKYRIRILKQQNKLDEFLTQFKSNMNTLDPNELWKLGEIEYILGKFGEAKETFDKVLAKDPKHKDTLISLYFNLNILPAAPHNKHPTMTAHLALEKVDPYHPVTRAAYGLGLPKEKALKIFEEALLLDSLNPDILAKKEIFDK